MSIIHNALKKVQQHLTSKTEETPEPASGTGPKGSSYLYETPAPPEAEPQTEVLSTPPKKPVGHKIKSLLALICAIAITIGSAWYLYHQYENYIPRFERYVKKTYYQLIHKEEIPEFKSKKPEDLIPLAKITIPAQASTPISTTASNTAQPIPPVPATILNVHGIMSNATGNVALINNKVYQEGDEVDGAKIIKIGLNSITVSINGTEKTIFVEN